MQTLAVVGNQPPKLATRGDVRALKEVSMFDDDPRWGDSRERDDDPRDLDGRDRELSDPRDVFMRELDLPRTDERQRVHDRDREYSLRESETRTLATVGAFRVVSSRDLNDHHGREADPQSGDLRHLREEGLIRTIPKEGSRDVAVVLTDRGKHLLESHRHDRDREDRQEFYAELKKPREMEHDAQIYGAYLREAERLQERGAHIERVVLDYELKREYQDWLHERDRGRADADGHPDRDEEEIETWAHEHDLPYFDGHVHFPDLRIEYEDRDGRDDHLDVEILTVHYRGARGSTASRSGFSCHGGSSARTGGSPFDPDYASRMF
jgi:DNA-binding MarR family transcriptional regulator